MIGNQQRWQEDLLVAVPLSSLIPDDHILKQADKVLDLPWFRSEAADCYIASVGRPTRKVRRINYISQRIDYYTSDVYRDRLLL